jgi:WD40 repeat protein
LPGGKQLVSVDNAGTIIWWDISSKKPLGHHRGADYNISFLALSEDGRTMVTGGTVDGQGNAIRLWSLPNKIVRKTIKAHGGFATGAFPVNDGGLITSGDDGMVCMRNAGTGQPRKTFRVGELSVAAMAVSPNGKTIAIACGEGREASVWSVTTGKCLARFKGHKQIVSALAFSPDGKVLAVGTSYGHDRAGEVKLWAIPKKRLRGTIEDIMGGVLCMAFSPDAKRLVTGGSAEGIKIWKMADVMGGH